MKAASSSRELMKSSSRSAANTLIYTNGNCSKKSWQPRDCRLPIADCRFEELRRSAKLALGNWQLEMIYVSSANTVARARSYRKDLRLSGGAAAAPLPEALRASADVCAGAHACSEPARSPA